MLSQSQTIECRNIDEVTSAEDIVEALKSQVGVEDTKVQVKLRMAYGGMKKTTIKVVSSIAPKILAPGKIELGGPYAPCAWSQNPRNASSAGRIVRTPACGVVKLDIEQGVAARNRNVFYAWQIGATIVWEDQNARRARNGANTFNGAEIKRILRNF